MYEAHVLSLVTAAAVSLYPCPLLSLFHPLSLSLSLSLLPLTPHLHAKALAIVK